MKITCSATMLLFSLALTAEEAPRTVVNPSTVAEKLHFPKDRLTFRDITDRTRKQLGTSVILATEVVGKEPNTFHPMCFVVARPATLLTDQFVRRINASIEASKSDLASVNFKRFDLVDGSWGYIGMEAMGPNGALVAATFTDSQERIDIKISFAFSFRELIAVPGGESYGKQFSGEIDATPALLEIVEHVVNAAQNLQLSAVSEERDAVLHSTQITPKPANTATRANSVLPPTTTDRTWVFALFFLVVISIAITLRWKRH